MIFFLQGGELPLVSHRQPSAPHHHQRGQGFIARESSVINGDICLHKEKLLDGMEIKSHRVHKMFYFIFYPKVSEYKIVCVKKNWKIDFSIEVCLSLTNH